MGSLIRNLVSTKLFISNNGFKSIARSCSGKLEQATHRVNDLEKRFLVWTGKYKSFAEVPERVAQSVVERARNRMRIRIANYMMAATVIGCVLMVISGKRAAKRGDSVQKDNVDWHKKMKEDITSAK